MQQRTLGAAATAVAVLLSANATQAEDGVTAAPVVVTATRTAQTADETVAPVTVISRDEIEASGATTLPDVLAGRPGIDLSRSGGFGKSTTINLRGLGNGKVLFLVNGTRVAAIDQRSGMNSTTQEVQPTPATALLAESRKNRQVRNRPALRG